MNVGGWRVWCVNVGGWRSGGCCERQHEPTAWWCPEGLVRVFQVLVAGRGGCRLLLLLSTRANDMCRLGIHSELSVRHYSWWRDSPRGWLVTR